MEFDRAFFERHQRILLWITNHRTTRWLLGVGKRVPKDLLGREIVQITPNAATWNNTNGSKETVAFVRPKFAESLSFNLAPICRFAKVRGGWEWQLSPVGAFGMFLAIVLFRESPFPVFFLTVSDFSPVAGANSPCDGEVTNNPGSSDWATVHDATAGTAASATDAQQVPYSRSTGGNYIINRSIINVDSSAIPDTDSISAASYNAYCETMQVQDADAEAYVSIVQSTPAATNNVATGDFDQLGTTKWATDINISSFTTSAFNAFTWNATGIAGISKTGITSFGLRDGHDIANSAIAAAAYNYTIFTSADGAANDPYLRVTHAAAASGPANLKTYNGLAKASVKTLNGLAVASVKTKNGLA